MQIIKWINHIWRMRVKKTTCKLQEKYNVLSGRKQRYIKVSVDTFLEIPEEMISEKSTLSTLSEDAISDEDISTQLIWSYSLCRNHTLIKTYLKTFYVTYLKDHFCRSQAGKWITLKTFSEDVFWRRFMRYQQYHATYSQARKEEYFKLFKRIHVGTTIKKRKVYYIHPNGYCLICDMFRSCKWESLSLNIPFMIIQRWKDLTIENDLFPTNSLKNEDFKWSSTRSIYTEAFQLEE